MNERVRISEKESGVLAVAMLEMFFGVDNSSSSHAGNRKNNVLILGEGDAFGINGNFGAPKKSLVMILIKHAQIFVRAYIINLIIVICLLMEKKSLSLKPTIAMLTFQLKFVSEVYLMELVLLSL